MVGIASLGGALYAHRMYTRYRHLAIARPKGEPTEEQIAAIEELVGVKLPDAFLAFLRVANGGYLEYLTRSPHPLGAWHIFSTEEGSDETFLHEIRSGRRRANIPDGVLPFARDGGGSVLYLDLTARGGASVAAFVRGKPAWAGGARSATEDAFVDIASSIDEFVSKLHLDRAAAVDHLAYDVRSSADVDGIETFLSIGLPDWRSDDELCAAVDAARRRVAEDRLPDPWSSEHLSAICNLAIEEARRRCRDSGRPDVTLEDVLIALLGDARSDFALLVFHYDLDPQRLRDVLERGSEAHAANDADRLTLSSLLTEASKIAARYGWPKVRSAALFVRLVAHRYVVYLDAIPWDDLDQNLPEILWHSEASEGDPTAPRELVRALTPECRAALERAIGLAKERGHIEVRIEHLLLGFLDVAGSDVATWVDVSAAEGAAARDALERELERSRPATAGKPAMSWRVWQLLSDAFAAEGRTPPLRTGKVTRHLLFAPHAYGFEQLAPVLDHALPNVPGIVDHRDLHPSAEQAQADRARPDKKGVRPSVHESFLVLRADTADSAFVREMEKVIEDAGVTLQSVFLYDHRHQYSDAVTEHVWVEHSARRGRDGPWGPPEDGGSSIGLVDDREVPARYVWIAGPDKQRVERIGQNLSAMLPVIEREDLKRQARDFERDPGALQRLAFGLNDTYDDAAARVVACALESDQRSVRDSAEAAALLLKWPELLGPLRAALAREPTEKGRRALEHVISRLETHETAPGGRSST